MAHKKRMSRESEKAMFAKGGTIKVRPKMAFVHAPGVGLHLNPKKTYTAVIAFNQPDYLEKGKVFLTEHGKKGTWMEMMLEREDYDIVSPLERSVLLPKGKAELEDALEGWREVYASAIEAGDENQIEASKEMIWRIHKELDPGKVSPRGKTAAERYNDRVDKIFAKARQLERERLARGEIPNENLTDVALPHIKPNMTSDEVEQLYKHERAQGTNSSIPNSPFFGLNEYSRRLGEMGVKIKEETSPPNSRVCREHGKEHKYGGSFEYDRFDQSTGMHNPETCSNKYSASQLKEMPTLHSGHFDNLKVETPDTRVWLSRCGTADGEPYDDKVVVEKLKGCKWVVVDEYEG